MSEDTIRVTLSKPIKVEDKEVTELTFREPEVGDLVASEGISSGVMGQTVATLAQMADVPLASFRKIKARDLNKIISATSGLLGNDLQEDGGTSPS
jgi:hypothetical protein